MLRRATKRFLDDNRGYVIALTLISMPMLLGFSLLVIDVGRTGNLHTDLQNAVDAMALAGARELDGRDDAIDRANAAIETLANSAAFGGGGTGMSLGSHITVSYDSGNDAGSTVTVHYLKSIPANDDATISPLSDYVAADANEASYAYVIAKPQAMTTIFPIPVGFNRDTINVAADAVAVYRASACDVTPIYICNPYEDPSGNNDEEAAEALHTNFAAGNLYGTQIELHSTASSSPGPGNFGFLSTYGNGANVLAEALATGAPGVCFKQDALETKTGVNAGPVEAGLNTRFGLYGGSFKNVSGNGRYRPARNVRSAQKQTGGANNICGDYDPVMLGDTVGDVTKAVPIGYGASMTSLPGGKISSGNDWDYDTYWEVAHGPGAPSTGDILNNHSSYPAAGTPSQPSAYDVYRYELNDSTLLAHTSANGEKGAPLTGGQCYSGPDLTNYSDGDYGDRREIFAAVLNCRHEYNAGRLTGHSTDTRAIAFARMFVTKPARASSGVRYLSLEMIDITGKGGLGTLDEFLREEAELVR